MSKRIPKIIISFEHNYYLDEDAFKMVNKLEQKNKQLKSTLTELEEWLNTYKSIGYEDIGTFQVVLDKIQKLKEKYK